LMSDGNQPNLLYYGDNLDILRRYVKDESVDLIYLDPPFKSNQDYNVLFKERNGTQSAAQIHAFEDTWQWDEAAALAYKEIVEAGGKVSQAMQAFHTYLGPNDMLAYLAMMAPRLVELRRVLKPTGSIYLHCDPTASHYLKILMDAVFGPQNFRNEITWKRTTAHSDARGKFAVVTDILHYYVKSNSAPFNVVRTPLDPEYVSKFYRFRDEDGRLYMLDNMRSPNPRPNLTYEYKGYEPHAKGWSVSREKMERLDREGRLFFPKDKAGRIRLKRYLDENKGAPVNNLWDDIAPVSSQAAERLGYPTQKPEALLERLINASSDKGDLVLDPFGGCGTAVIAAERLGRRWIGIDITHLAITLMKKRLFDTFGKDVKFTVVGEPTDVAGAEALAKQDPYQFQWWALGLVDARPAEGKKGADKGIDGRIYFHDEQGEGKTKQVILSVKAGHTNVAHVRDLNGVLTREGAEIGVLITLEEPTQPMRTEAADAGFYHSLGWNMDCPRIQLRTIAELLAGKGIEVPPQHVTFKQAPKYAKDGSVQLEMPDLIVVDRPLSAEGAERVLRGQPAVMQICEGIGTLLLRAGDRAAFVRLKPGVTRAQVEHSVRQLVEDGIDLRKVYIGPAESDTVEPALSYIGSEPSVNVFNDLLQMPENAAGRNAARAKRRRR
jgi:site-specific DNA-methyltransferase (adenine-specific)